MKNDKMRNNVISFISVTVIIGLADLVPESASSFNSVFMQELNQNLLKMGARCSIMVCLRNQADCNFQSNLKEVLPMIQLSADQEAIIDVFKTFAKACPYYIFLGDNLEPVNNVIKKEEKYFKKSGMIIALAPHVSSRNASLFFQHEETRKFASMFVISKLNASNSSMIMREKQLCGTRLAGVWPHSPLVDMFRKSASEDKSCIKLKATAFPYAPYTKLDGTKEGNEAYSGFEVQVFKIIANKLGYEYTINPPTTCCVWGRETPPGSGNYTGLVGDLQFARSDIGWANMFITPERARFIDYTAPYRVDNLCFLVPTPQPLPSWMSIILPFDSISWIAIGVTMVVSALFLCFYTLSNHDKYLKATSTDMIIYVVAVFFDESQQETTKFRSNVIRLFICPFLLGAFITTVGFKGGLISSLSVPSYGKSLESPKDLSNAKFQVKSGTIFPVITESENKYLKDLSTRYEATKNLNEEMDNMLRSKKTIVGSKLFFEYKIREKFTDRYGVSNLQVMKECLVPHNVAFGVPKSSIHGHQIGETIQRLLEAGLINKWLNDELDQVGVKVDSKKAQTTGQAKAWKLDQLQAPFTVYGFLITLAFIALVLELTILRPKSNKTRETPSP